MPEQKRRAIPNHLTPVIEFICRPASIDCLFNRIAAQRRWSAATRPAPYTHLASRRDGLKLARHFSAGIVETRFPSSPVGTADLTHMMSKPAILSVVPTGTPNLCPRIFPALKCRAILRASLTGRRTPEIRVRCKARRHFRLYIGVREAQKRCQVTAPQSMLRTQSVRRSGRSSAYTSNRECPIPRQSRRPRQTRARSNPSMPPAPW